MIEVCQASIRRNLVEPGTKEAWRWAEGKELKGHLHKIQPAMICNGWRSMYVHVRYVRVAASAAPAIAIFFLLDLAWIFVHAQAEKSSEPEAVWSVDFEQCRISQRKFARHSFAKAKPVKETPAAPVVQLLPFRTVCCLLYCTDLLLQFVKCCETTQPPATSGITTQRKCAPCREWRCSCDGLQHAVDSTGIRSTMNSVLLKLFLTHIDSTARTWRVRDLFLPENLRKVPCAAKTGIETSSCLTLSPGNPSTCATLQLTCEDSLDPAGCFRSRNRGGAVMA